MQGKLVRLRPYERRDLDDVMRWVHDREVTAHLGPQLTVPASRVAEEQWLETMLHPSPDHVAFAIETVGAKYLGGCDLRAIDWIDRRAECGIVIGFKEFQGKGYGTEAMRLLLQVAFDRLNLNRVSLHVYETNPRAIASYEKCGFKREGLLREFRYIDGRYVNALLMAVLRSEWRPGL